MTTDERVSRTLAEMAAEMQAQPDDVMTAEVVAERIKALVIDADHVSVTVRVRGAERHTTLASTDASAETADALQYELDEGPCLEASDSGVGWLRSGDLGSDHRWPRWGPKVSAVGLGSVLSVSLVVDDAPIGALNLYNESRGRFVDPEVVDLALIYATHAAGALASARTTHGLRVALSSRHTIGMAQGIIMERFRLDEARSFELLRRLSSQEEIKIRDLAAEIVRTRSIPA